MTTDQLEEYRNLRATIRERGTARVWVFVVGLSAWGALLAAVWRFEATPLATLIPLLVLGGTFEAVFMLHAGAERIGRYIHVFLEGEDAGWEHRVAALAQARPMKIGDPLFFPVFLGAVLLNAVPALTAAASPGELVLLSGLHLIVAGRILDARRRAAGQRAADQQAFERLRER